MGPAQFRQGAQGLGITQLTPKQENRGVSQECGPLFGAGSGPQSLLQGRSPPPPQGSPTDSTQGAVVCVNIRGDPEATGRWQPGGRPAEAV